MRRLLFLLPLITTMIHAQTPTVQYRLGMPKPWTHLFHVEVTHSNLPESEAKLDLVLPVWRSGRYIILDFAGGVQEFSAVDEKGTALKWEKIDKKSWRIQTSGSRTVKARYKVYANEFSLRTKGLSDEGAFLDGTAAFMYSESARSLPLTLVVEPYATWKISTGLEQAGRDPNSFTAPNYDYLADCPLLIGNLRIFEFEALGKKHVLSVLGEGEFESKDLTEDLIKIVEVNKEFWGRLPYDRYVFMLMLSQQGGGGTEHLNSTIMITRPSFFGSPGSYRSFLGLVSHEFFHTWNVKQIRPKGLNPYDWTKENYTKELWVAEGTTSYYGSLLLIRAGFQTAEEYIGQLPRQIQGDRRRPGNRKQSVVESSFDAWVKYWKGNENSYNTESDYYDRGADLSLALDLEIRHRSANKHSLDDVMRALFERFPLNGTGYTVDDVQALCGEFSGSSFQKFFDEHIFGTEPIPWEKLLSFAGLEVTPKKDEKAWLGVYAADRGEKTVVRFLLEDSPAYNAGLSVGDELVALNDARVRGSEFASRIESLNIGDPVKLTVMRDDQLREFTVKLGSNPVPDYSVKKVKNPSAQQKTIYESWLSTSWE